MNVKLYGIAAAVMLAFAGTAAQAQTTAPGGTAADRPAARTDTTRDARTTRDAKPNRAERRAKDAEEERIEAEYKADKAKCESMQGNAKDVCEKEAKGKEKVAKAELDAKKNPTPRNQRKVEEAKADAEYDVAREKCDDMKGNEKDACQKDAKAQRDKTKAALAKRNASTGASSAPRERRDTTAARPAPSSSQQGTGK